MAVTHNRASNTGAVLRDFKSLCNEVAYLGNGAR